MRVVIVGAGCMGVATAYHLATAGVVVTVLDRDLSLARSSTLLSDGNVRVQFNLPENIAMSLYAMEMLERFGHDTATGSPRGDIGMRRQGNLFLVAEDGIAEAMTGLDRQRDMGCAVSWLDSDEVARRWGPLASDRYTGATFGSDDGSVDPWAVTMGYRRAAEERGVVFEQAEVATLDTGGGIGRADGTAHQADAVVVCAGAWSTELLATAGVEIPVVPVMRTVYVVSTDVGAGVDLPTVFLPSGVYLIPEPGATFLMGWSTEADPVGFDFTPADRSRFYDLIWPELVSWLPAFDRLEVVRSWAGLYEQNTLDANAIIGEWPTLPGLFQATGFSGHGFQQCHAVGRHLAELIIGSETSLDLSRLSPLRVMRNEPLFEHAGRII